MTESGKGRQRTLSIGFDVGGSRSSMIARIGDDEPLCFTFEGSWKYTDVGTEASVARCIELITQSLAPEPADVVKVMISMSGASDVERNAEFVGHLTQRLGTQVVRVRIEGDSAFALRAAYPAGESGYLIIAGTGSVAIARTIDGEVLKAGGWGRFLGDEGSGYWIGMQALKHYARSLDKGEAAGILFDRLNSEIESRFEKGMTQFRSALYSDALSPAVFTRIVFACSDDPAADAIIREGAQHLASLISVLDRKGRQNIRPVLTLHGSVACNPIYGSAIAQAIAQPMEIRLLDENALLQFALSQADEL